MDKKIDSAARTCARCGAKFYPRSGRQLYCGQDIEVPCVICGKMISTMCISELPQTCSQQCSAELANRRREEESRKKIKVCKWCGEEFHPKSARSAYCDRPHFKKCEVCGKDFEIDVKKRTDRRTCSKECFKVLQLSHRDLEAEHESLKRTLKKKYGVENAMQIPGVVDKIKATNRDRYGHDWYTQTDEYKASVERTDMEKYGVTHHVMSPEVISKRNDTIKSKYGVGNVFQSEEVKSKIKSTLKKIYGVDYISQSSVIRNRIEENNLGKYGVRYPTMLKSIQNKIISTNLERYDREWFTQMHIEDIDAWMEFMKDPKDYIQKHYDEAPRSVELAKDLGVDHGTVDVYLAKHNAYECVTAHRSSMEYELLEFLKSIDPDIDVITNDRKIIKPLELDLYLPKYKIAFECNPTCTHNSSLEDPWGAPPKDRMYHNLKSKMCYEQGVFLFHIFGYEWSHRQDIIKSMIRNLLKANMQKIYARNCVIKHVDPVTCNVFLDINHRQGSANSPVRIGLYCGDQLVSIMTFGKMRATIGTSNNFKDTSWELVRFCSIRDTTVVGGASKLFKYFLKEFRPRTVKSFSDRAHTQGNLYEALGFHCVNISDPGYVWVNLKTDLGYHRMNAQKRNLKKFLKDDSIDLNKTERKIMVEHGFVQVYDSGTITWIYET